MFLSRDVRMESVPQAPNEEEFLWRAADPKTVLNGTAASPHLEF
jgi:hypothetical protein